MNKSDPSEDLPPQTEEKFHFPPEILIQYPWLKSLPLSCRQKLKISLAILNTRSVLECIPDDPSSSTNFDVEYVSMAAEGALRDVRSITAEFPQLQELVERESENLQQCIELTRAAVNEIAATRAKTPYDQKTNWFQPMIDRLNGKPSK